MAERRRHLARWLLSGLLAAVAAAAGLGLAVAWLAGRPASRAWLADEIGRRVSAALHQPFSVQDVRLSAYPLRLALVDVRIGKPERPFMTARSIEVGVGGVRLAEREVVLNQVRLVGVRLAGEPPELPEGTGAGRGWFGVVVHQLDVEDLAVSALELPAGIELSVGDAELRWAGKARSTVEAAVVLVSSFSASARGVGTLRGSLQAWGGRNDRGWELRRLRGSGPGWQVDASGALVGGVLSGKGTAVVDLHELDEMFHVGAGLEGAATARWEAQVGGGRFHVDAGVSADRVAAGRFTFSDVAGTAHISPEGIEAELKHVGFAGGSLSGSYLLEKLGPPWPHTVAVRAVGVTLDGFMRQLGVGSGGLSGDFGASAELDWDGKQVKAGIGTAVVDLTAGQGTVPLAGRATLGLHADGALSIASEDMTVAGAPVHWDGRLTIGSWVPTWTIRGERLPIPTVATLLAGWTGSPVLPAGLDGETAVDVRLRGPFDHLDAVGDVVAAPVSLGVVAVDTVRGSFAFSNGRLSFEDGVVSLGAGRARVGGTIDLTAGGALAISLSGTRVPLARVVSWSGLKLPVRGSGGFKGRIGGTLDRPTLSVQLRLADVSVADVPFGDGGGTARLDQDVLDIPALEVGPFASRVRLDFGRRLAEVHASLKRFGLDGISPLLARIAGDGLDVELDGAFPFAQPAGRLRIASANGATGHVEMDAAGIRIELGRPHVWTIGGEIRPANEGHRGELSYTVLSLTDLAREVAGEEVPVTGQARGTAIVTLRPDAPARVDGAVDSLTASVNGDAVSLQKPARFAVVGSELDVPSVSLAGPTASVDARVHRGAGGSLAAHVAGRVPASLVGLLWPDAKLGGMTDVTVDVSGTEARPVIVGSAVVRDGSILLPQFPGPLTHVSGTVDFVPEAISLHDMDFTFGGGTGRASGQITLSPALELDVSARVADVRWPVTPGFNPGISGDLRIVGSPDSLSVSGDTTLQRTVFREDINLQRLVLQQLRAPQRALAPESGGVTLNLRVVVPGTFEVATPLARLSLRGQVRVVGTSTQTGMLGQLEVAPGGELELSGQQYELERGTLTFSDPNAINPFLDIVARVEVGTVEITVGLLGTIDRLTPTLTSNPPLPETDILALLSTGRRADQATQAQAGAVAGSFLTEQLAGAVTRRARALLDVDQLRLDPFAATETGNPTARVTVVKQLSPDWLVTVSTNLTSNREEIVQSRWRVGQGMYVQASRDIDGSYSMELKWLHRY